MDWDEGYGYGSSRSPRHHSNSYLDYPEYGEPETPGYRDELFRLNDWGHRSPPSARSRSRPERFADEETVQDSDLTSTVASTVGFGWRSMKASQKKQKGGNHPSRVPAPTGRRMALLCGIDDESQATFHSIQTMGRFLSKRNYAIEHVIDTGVNEPQFEIDVEAGLSELIALAHPGDAIVLYCINFGLPHRHNASSLLHRFAHNLPSGVRLTCVFDCCYVTAKPAYLMDFSVEKVYTARTAGLKHLRRLAYPIGPVTQQIGPDIFVFMGENPTGKTLTFRTTVGMHGIYTAAWVRAYSDEDTPLLASAPTYAKFSERIEQELRMIRTGALPHRTTSEVLCVKPYDIDQKCYL
eukprot:NODE_2173_length_1260_cov_184.477493_g2066_i0.p1 GENE.NODE_2173_length_1260_cov_184.477493_g2066_i0~~NODE_2173_length_1260_cov_184.477493_g2066_i0.p1  ORF type:complete len:352 (-),score=52.58 NODE_2173_length_1260_cov_184.477493_g2066_i0:144-1199(-)